MELVYKETDDVFLIMINEVSYYLGHDGVNWDGGTTNVGDATDFNSGTNSILKQLHSITLFMDIDSDLVNLWIDGDHIINDVAQDLSDVSGIGNVITLGGIPLRSNGTIDTSYFNGCISNFCVHPKTESLPIDQTKPFKDPNKQYGKDAQWFLDQFGNFPGASLMSGAGGIVEEGQNVNGDWIRFESGLRIYSATVSMQFATRTNTFPYPMGKFQRKPFYTGVLSGTGNPPDSALTALKNTHAVTNVDEWQIVNDVTTSGSDGLTLFVIGY
jgi:hypothetical protein